jgi:hypothetical protein
VEAIPTGGAEHTCSFGRVTTPKRAIPVGQQATSAKQGQKAA